MGGRVCSICTSDQSAEITKAIGNGVTFAEIALRFNTTNRAAHHHRVKCMGVPAKPRKKPPPTAPDEAERRLRYDRNDPQALIATTARLVDEALDLLAGAKKVSDTRTALSALKEARDGLALLMRAAGLLGPDSQVNVNIDQRKLQVALGSRSDADLEAMLAELAKPALATGSEPVIEHEASDGA
jgi:hypothetical protein